MKSQFQREKKLRKSLRKIDSKFQKGGNIKYLLIDNDDRSNVFETDGNSVLLFNDGTTSTFNETYELVKKTKLASKCYFIAKTNIWYQFIYQDDIVYQYSCDGVFIRHIEQVQQLSDEQIRTLIKVDVHAGPPSTEFHPNPKYDKWENDLLRELENGNTSVYHIKSVIYNYEKLDEPPYLGGRWLSGFLNSFYPFAIRYCQ